MKERGKFIVFYGMNNLGKTTLAKNMAEYLRGRGLEASYLKYALYDFPPTGPRINAYLREGNPEGLTPLQFQWLQVKNRRDFESLLVEKWLDRGRWVVAEDYAGTGIAWGVIEGLPVTLLERMNAGLLKPDLELLLDGERFMSGKEEHHAHEGSMELWNEGKNVHIRLARRYGWIKINANQPEGKVLSDVAKIVESRLSITPEGQIGFGPERSR